jgi:hypothetical protein
MRSVRSNDRRGRDQYQPAEDPWTHLNYDIPNNTQPVVEVCVPNATRTSIGRVYHRADKTIDGL